MANRWQMVDDRDAGMTYKQIAEKHGCSVQYVGRVVGKYNPKNFHAVTETGCIYPNLIKWMNDNKISASELVRRMYLEPLPDNINRLRNVMRGHSNPRKDYIDRMMAATGMTYQKLFKEG
jgi:transcriptional regulator with XRE-family HTH domain